MKYLGILLLALIAFTMNAQDTNALKDKFTGLKKKLEGKTKADTLKLPGDSLKSQSTKFDSLQLTNRVSFNKLDSIPKFQLPRLRQDNSKTKADSLRLVKEKANQRVAELQNKFTSEEDSLQRKLEGKTRQLQDKGKSIESITEKANINIPSSDKKLPGNELNNGLPVIPKLPDTNAQKSPDLNPSLPAAEIPGIKTDMPATDVLKNKIPNIDTKLPGVPDSTNQPDVSSQLEKIPGTEKVKDVTEKAGELKGLKGEADEYTDKAKELKNTKLEDVKTESLEKEASQLGETKEISDQTQKLKSLQAKKEAMLQRYVDKKSVQEELKRKSSHVVNDKINKFSPSFEKKQPSIGKTKKLYENSSLVPDSTKKKKRINTMAGKPFKHRIIPGVNFQTYSGNDEVLIDLSAQAGFRLTGWLTVGTGLVYRIGMGKSHPSFVGSKNVYGYRFYADYTLIKGFFVHADFESIQVGRPQFEVLRKGSDKVLGSYVGLGKHYSISRNFRGNLMALFKVNYSGSIPGQNKFTIRVGFDYVYKKKKKVF